MQISNAAATTTSAYHSSEKIKNTPIISTNERAEKSLETSDLKPYNKILENYDISNISPNEIDELYNELIIAGHPLNKEMFQLSTRGAEWRQHLAEIGAEATNTEVTFDPDKKINLFTEVRGNIEFNRQHGFDTAHYENLLKFIAKLDGAVLTDGRSIAI